jgi:hypothetical protein
VKVDAATEVALPSFITYSDVDGTMSVDLTNPNVTGIYLLKIVAKEAISGLVHQDVKFTLEMTCTTTFFYNFSKGVKNVYYEIPYDLTSPNVKLSLPVYKTTPDYCLLQPYTLTLSKQGEASSQLPGFIKLNKNTVNNQLLDISIFNRDPSVVGEFKF